MHNNYRQYTTLRLLFQEKYKEVVADLIGDYLFTDRDFVQSLSTQNRNVFQKIFDEVKYLCRVAVAGSKEARELEKIRKAMAEVYRGTKGKVDGVKYNLGDINYPRKMVGFGDVNARRAAEDETVNSLISRGKVTKIPKDIAPEDLSNVNWSDKSEARNAIKGVLKGFLGDDVVFNLGNDSAIAYLTSKGLDHTLAGENTAEKASALSAFHQLIGNAEYSYSGLKDTHSKTDGREDWDYFVSVAEIDGTTNIPLVFAVRSIDQDVRSQIYSIATKKNLTIPRGDGTQINTANAHPSYGDSSSSGEIVKQETPGVNPQYLDAVNRGDMETAQRMVDQAAKEAGYTNLFYHGSKKGGGFTEFRDWSYFTESKQYAQRYAERDNPDSLYQTYVKMEKPFDTRNEDARRLFSQIREEYGLSDIQDSGLPDWTDGYDIAEYIDENGLDYDGIILDEGGDLVNGEPVSRGLSYVIRKSARFQN